MPGLLLNDLSSDIIRLYSNVLNEDVRTYRVNEHNIKRGIREMGEAYKGNPLALQTVEKNNVLKAHYNIPAFRCAYLHKYAACHTGLVSEMFLKCLLDVPSVLGQLAVLQPLKLCSLGGGPGSDVIGVLLVLSATFGYDGVHHYLVTIVDCMGGWNATFKSIISELTSGYYGRLSLPVSPYNFSSEYLTSDLLGTWEEEVSRAISGADLVTMVKFVSAAACQETRSMVHAIFQSMKPGALVFFIDNAAGGFYELVAGVARDLEFKSVFGPLRHHLYQNQAFAITRYNYKSLSETRVSVHMWKKLKTSRQKSRSGKISGRNTGRRIAPSTISSSNANVAVGRQSLDRTPGIRGYSANRQVQNIGNDFPVRQSPSCSSNQRSVHSADRKSVLSNSSSYRNPKPETNSIGKRSASSHGRSPPAIYEPNNYTRERTPTNRSDDFNRCFCCTLC